MLTNSDRERMIDLIVSDRLRTDARYVYAENAQAQAAREAEVTEQVEREIDARYSPAEEA
jgi:hypothetical protein